MGSYAWFGLGAFLGWAAAMMSEDKSFVLKVESVCVSMFGAFIGGEFVPAMLAAPLPRGASAAAASAAAVAASAVTPSGLGFAVAGSVLSLFLLRVMRRAVGPLKVSKKRQRD